MTRQSIVLIGGPDSGKTNYVGRLWQALDGKTCGLVAAQQPQDLSFVLDTAEHLFQARFAPRTEHAEDRRDFEVVVGTKSGDEMTIVVPDISGELWQTAVKEFEIDQSWMDEIQSASGAILFVRVGSDQDVRPLDWVTSSRLLQRVGQDSDRDQLPTQVMVCELIRYLELSMIKRPDGGKPRIALMVAAWDRVDPEIFKDGPNAYLKNEYPLLAGRIADCESLDIGVFGLSVVGGDLNDEPAVRAEVLEKGLDSLGWVAIFDTEIGEWRKDPDLTLPIAWAIGI